MLTGTRLSSQYGEVLNLVLSSKKAGTAVVEFATIKAAVSAPWGFGGRRQPCHSRGGIQFCGPSELRCPHSRGISGPTQSQDSPEPLQLPGVEAQQVKGWTGEYSGDGFISCCLALHPPPSPGSQHASRLEPWHCLLPFLHSPVRKLTWRTGKVRASAYHRVKFAVPCLEDESAGSGSLCGVRESLSAADWSDGTRTGCCI